MRWPIVAVAGRVGFPTGISHRLIARAESYMEGEVATMAAKVDEMHAILLQARGVRWAIIAVAGLVGRTRRDDRATVAARRGFKFSPDE